MINRYLRHDNLLSIPLDEPTKHRDTAEASRIYSRTAGTAGAE